MSSTMLRDQVINLCSFMNCVRKKSAHTWITAFCLIILSGCSTLSDMSPIRADQNTTNTHPIAIDVSNQKTHIQQALAAEFALLRGETKKAFDDYFTLANVTKNTLLAEKSASIALSLNDPQLIIKATDLWLSIDPSAQTVYPIRFRVFILDNQSKKITDTVLNAYHNSVPLRFLNQVINAFASSPAYLEAVDIALNQLPDYLTSQLEIRSAQAHTAYLQGNYQDAKKIAQSMIDESNQKKVILESNIYFILALIQQQEGNTKEAIKTLEHGLTLYPNEYALISSLIDFEIMDQHFDIAKKHYDGTTLSPLQQSQLSIHYISLLIQHNQATAALDALKDIDYLSTGFSERFYFLEANALANLNQKQEAIEKLQQINGQLFNNATEQIVVWLYDLKKENEINNIIAYRFNKRQNIEQVLNIMQHHEDNLRPQLSAELADIILQRQPDADPIRYKKALLADTLGDWQTTEKELRFLLDKDSENANYLNALGYTLLVRSNRYNEAIEFISLAYDKEPENPAIIDSLGWGYFLQGNLEKAESLLHKAWSILPEAEIGAHYGEALWAQKKYDEATIIWQKALETIPVNPALTETLNRLNPSMLK